MPRLALRRFLAVIGFVTIMLAVSRAGAWPVSAQGGQPLAPGLYVSSLRIEPPQPTPNQPITFFVTFLNNSGPYSNFRWLVQIYTPFDDRRAIGQTSADAPFDIPVSTTEFQSLGFWKIGPGEPCQYFTARVVWLDNDKKATPFRKPDGSAADFPLTVCAAWPTVAPTVVVAPTATTRPVVVAPPAGATPSTLAPGGALVSKMVSATQGGSVQLPDGTRVDIPPGALATDTLISISEQQAPESLRGSSLAPLTFPTFGPSGIHFLKPARVTLPYGAMNMSDALDADAVFMARWNGREWEYSGGTVDTAAKMITADVTGFSQYVPFKLLNSEKAKAVAEDYDTVFNKGPVDSDWTDLANKIFDRTGKWSVVNADINNAGSLGQHRILADKDLILDWASKFPARKRSLLIGPILGHEEAHDLHGDLNEIRTLVDMLAETLKVRTPTYEKAEYNRLYAKLMLSIAESLVTHDRTPIDKTVDQIFGIMANDNPACVTQRDKEMSADHDGVLQASQTSPNWAFSEDGLDVKVQTILVFVHVVEDGFSPNCAHPSGIDRANAVRHDFLKNNDGGVYGTIAAVGCDKKGIRVTAPNGAWTVTDEDGRYLLAPIPDGTNSITAVKPGSPEVAIDLPIPVPQQDLVERSFGFMCSVPPPSGCVTGPTLFDPPNGRIFNANNTILSWKDYALRSGEYFEVQEWPEGGGPRTLTGVMESKNGVWSLRVNDLYAWDRGKHYWTVRVKGANGSYVTCEATPFTITLVEKEPPQQNSSSSSSSWSSSWSSSSH